MVLETGDVSVTAPLIGSALGLPTKGDSFKELDENVHGNLIDTYEGMTIKKLKDLVIQCSVSMDAQNEDFRRYFIFFVMKNFLFLTSGKTITKAHISTVIDILYFHSNKHGPIKKCIGKYEPWTKEWTTAKLKRVSKEEADHPSDFVVEESKPAMRMTARSSIEKGVTGCNQFKIPSMDSGHSP
ncbi:hypothetical protein PIB30_071688 [Stylosanthes scabra]|uniref:Uncharacterized protein n=1 Tax=Stylosanthes scabra TaxID=79078 RepID=A0ABU6RNT1_9FABA|nr:hypothetical protein [Stylosanthes scabra]